MKNLAKISFLSLAVLAIISCGGGGSKDDTSKQASLKTKNTISNATLVDANGQVAQEDKNGIYSFKSTPTYPVSVKRSKTTYIDENGDNVQNENEPNITQELISCSNIKTSSSTYTNDNSSCKNEALNFELRELRSDVNIKDIQFVLIGRIVKVNPPADESTTTTNPTNPSTPTTTTNPTTSETRVLKTGQTKSYATGDDGYYQKGIARSYARSGDIVIDNVTKLQWQDDTDAKTVLKTWEDAKTYCSGLTLGGYSDWRLPSIQELLSIADLGKYNPAIDSTFQNVSSNGYWSSTSTAWYVGFDDGDDGWSNKSSSGYVRCVRAGQ